MDVFLFLALVVVGFTACAEFAYYALVHPIIKRLPQNQHIQLLQKFDKTIGRAMPVLLPLSSVLLLTLSVTSEATGLQRFLVFMSFGLFILAIIITLSVNVPINVATSKWEADNPPKNWLDVRRKWETFMTIRAWLLIGGFIALCAHAVM